jgi:hypothetical protein
MEFPYKLRDSAIHQAISRLTLLSPTARERGSEPTIKAKEERREDKSRRLLNTGSDHMPHQGAGVCCNVAWHVIWTPKEWIKFYEILGIRPLLIGKLPKLHYTV